jgi:peptidyl-prolyl cis-trans isomerase B (cyclophilin B)
VASTKDRQRALERARYERVQAKIASKRVKEARRRRITIFAVVGVIIVGGGLWAGIDLASSGTTKPVAATTPSSAASAAPSASASSTPATVGYVKSATPASKDVGIPTYNAAAAAKPYTATIKTNLGNIVFQALTTKAPYTTFSFEYLAGKDYFNNTPCHRLTTSGIYVLQCGDPTGTGSGGPGYTFQDENLTYLGAAGASGSVTYPAGTIAMANSGANTNGSQFFLVYKDSPLPPSYTPWGKITSGMDVLQGIAAKGSNNKNATGDGNPNETVTIESVTISQS